ncbi:MAG: TRAP transporter small permease [Planctomycetota bacterium]|jgi:TRAP-type C4-dicarboxylate transport system permease small subunit|nr:TRAP transporter small permease [Planctomycetota bacterium]
MSGGQGKRNFFIMAQECLSLAFFTFMCVLMVLQLLSRYVLRSPLLFTEEFSRLSYVWVAFLGMAVAHHRRDHIRVDLFLNLLPPGGRRAAEAILDLASCAILAYLGWWGVKYMDFNQWNVAASMDIPLYYVYASFPAGCALAIANILGGLPGRLRAGGQGAESPR